MRLLVDPAPFPSTGGYRIGLVDETYAPTCRTFEIVRWTPMRRAHRRWRSCPARAGHHACAEGVESRSASTTRAAAPRAPRRHRRCGPPAG